MTRYPGYFLYGQDSSGQYRYNPAQEKEEWENGLKMLGLPPGSTVSFVIDTIMKGKLKKDISAEENAIYENAMREVKLQTL